MTATTLSRVLAECLEAIERGESMERCLANYPEYGEELRALLELAVALRRTSTEPQPSEEFLRELRKKLTEEG